MKKAEVKKQILELVKEFPCAEEEHLFVAGKSPVPPSGLSS